MEKINNVMSKICKIMAYLGFASIVIMIVATVVDVVLRKAVGQSFPGATEIVTYFLTAVVYFGVGYCAHEREMITIDLFKKNIVCVVINNILAIAAGIIIVYTTALQAIASHAIGGASLRLQIPKWPFMGITAIGFLMICIVLVIHTVEDIKEHRNGKLKTNEEGVEQ